MPSIAVGVVFVLFPLLNHISDADNQVGQNVLHAMQAIGIRAYGLRESTIPTQTFGPEGHDELECGEDATKDNEEPETLVGTRYRRNRPFLQEFFPMKAQILPR